MGLAGCADSAKLQELSADQFASVRLGVLLAMRIQKDPAIARFLFDPDFRIATEATRAIWDVPIPGGFASLLKETTSPATARRLMRCQKFSP